MVSMSFAASNVNCNTDQVAIIRYDCSVRKLEAKK